MGFTNDVPFIQVYVDGVVSKMLGELEIGSEINFKHLKRNIKQQYPLRAKKKLTISGELVPFFPVQMQER